MAIAHVVSSNSVPFHVNNNNNNNNNNNKNNNDDHLIGLGNSVLNTNHEVAGSNPGTSTILNLGSTRPRED